MKAKAHIHDRLADHFGGAALRTIDPWRQNTLPIVRPMDRSMLLEVLRFARSDSMRLLPLGRGTKIGRRLPPERLDMLVDMRDFNRVIAFEPADGTLTAEGGIAFDELVRLCRSGARSIVPEIPQGASLGGAIATAETGTDRLLRGPIRDHILGLDVVLSDGSSSRSGGRLVKNVAGYDLHRLHTGAWGSLGFILEATVRLFPAPPCEECLSTPVHGLAHATDLAFAIGREQLPAKRIWSTTVLGETQLSIELSGRKDVVAAARGLARRQAPGLAPLTRRQEPRRPSLVLHAMPSAAHTLAIHSNAILAALPQDTELNFDPLLAQSSFTITNRCSLDIAKLVASFIEAASSEGVHFALPRFPAPTQPLADEITRDIHHALDPTETFAN